jgi:hypothetical protein
MRALVIGLLLIAALGGRAPAQEAPPARISWSMTVPDAQRAVAPGERLDVAIRAVVERGWYVYAMVQPPGGPTPLRFTVPEGQPFVLARPVTGPEPVRGWDAAFEIDTAKHAGTVVFTVPVEVAEDAVAGKGTLTVQVRHQVCSDTLCLRPKTESLVLPVEVRRTAPPGPRRE